MLRRIRRLKKAISALGPAEGLRYIALRRVFRPVRNALLKPKLYALRSPHARHPLWARSNSSDLEVFHQIFIALEYQCLAGLQGVDLVIDCGANVGYSSAYFLSQFPTCRVIAVEPDAANFEMLAKNLAPYGDRATLHRAGIWSHSTELVIDDANYRDGREWTRQVRPRRADEPGGLPATDIDSLMKNSGRARVSLLKMDIEGAEVVVFSAADRLGWLDRVDALAVELHDDTHFGKATEVFFPAIAPHNFEISESGELTIGVRRRPAPGAPPLGTGAPAV